MTTPDSHTNDDEPTPTASEDDDRRRRTDGGDHRPLRTDGGDPAGNDEGGGADPPAHDDRGGGAAGRGDIPTPDEMSLDELREEIRAIDEDLVELIARRTYVADTIAQVKQEEGLPTTDESQEQRVMDRAGANAERFDVDANLVKAIFRLLIELNKVEQRESR